MATSSGSSEMLRTFASRLSLAFAGVGIAAAALTALLVNGAFGTRLTGYLQDQRVARQSQLTGALADSYARMGGWDAVDLDSLAPIGLMDGGTLRVVDASGDQVWEASGSSVGPHMSEAHREMMGTGPLGPERRVEIRVDGYVVGTAIFRLPEAGLLPQDVAFRRSMNRSLFAGGLAAAAASFGLGVLLARRATAPARALSAAARAFAAGEHDTRIPPLTSREFAEMGLSFNEMADTLEEEDRLRRTFAADVAHELRTPLAILRSQIEALQDGLYDPSTHVIASLHEEILRLSRLVGDLETLASADASGFSLVKETVDLREVAAQVMDDLVGTSASQEVALTSELAEAQVIGDRTRLVQVASNLIVNALKFTPSGGSVRIETRLEDGSAVLKVTDNGHGVAEDELPKVFDRFFRGSGAKAGGSGIGLAVAKQIVEAHEGSIAMQSRLGVGTSVQVRLPSGSRGGKMS